MKEKHYIIAEIGWNHMGDMDLAKKMIKSASENGAEICKFQTWSEKNLMPGAWDTDGRREIYKNAELSKEDHHFLKEYCEDNSIRFLTSVFNINDLDFLSSLDEQMIKIPSHEVHNLELIKSAVDLFDTVLISTGAAKWQEIMDIVESIELKNVVLMHCVSTYPCNAENINFPRMDKIKEYSNTFGYSGHYSSIDDAIVAVCHGATYIEKHFTIDNTLPGRDNQFAILPDQLKILSEFIENYEKMNINLGLDLQDCELDTFSNYRGRWSKND